MTHPDEAVKPEREAASELVAEAQLRHENAHTDWATPQERKQADVEEAHALATRPDGSYAQLHETEKATLAVADEKRVGELREEQETARESLQGSEPANTPAGIEREEKAAQARAAERQSGSADRQTGPANERPTAEKSSGTKASGSK